MYCIHVHPSHPGFAVLGLLAVRGERLGGVGVPPAHPLVDWSDLACDLAEITQQGVAIRHDYQIYWFLAGNQGKIGAFPMVGRGHGIDIGNISIFG